MSVHTICDKCSKPLDDGETYVQVTVIEVATGEEGATTVVTPAVVYDYHPQHAPKFQKGKIEEPVEPEPPEPNQDLPGEPT